jgi:hypothetical protein
MSLWAERMSIPWAKLEPEDVGNLVSFLNRPATKTE